MRLFLLIRGDIDMKRIIAFSLVFVTVFSASAKLDPFSVYKLEAPENCVDRTLDKEQIGLTELIQMGICTNPALNRSYMSVKSSEAEVGQAKAEYLPSVTATGSASVSGTKYEKGTYDKRYPYSGNVGLDWLLFDFGGRSARLEKMKAYLSSAEFNYNAQLQETILSINNAYLRLLGAKEVLSSAKDSEKSYKKAYEESKRRYDLGLVALSDKLLAKTSYEQSKLTTLKAENTVKQAQGNLATLLNLTPDTSFNLMTPPKDKDITKLETTESVEKMMELALEQRPELKSKESGVQAAKENISAVRSTTLPTVSASGSAGYGDVWRKSSPYQLSTSAGVRLNVPLFTGFNDTYKVAAAEYQYRQAQYGLQETQNSIRNEVWSAYQDYQTAVEAYKISQAVLDSAKENERVAMKSYEVGKGDILNLLTATSQMSDARQGFVNAFYSVLISKANLYRAVGRF